MGKRTKKERRGNSTNRKGRNRMLQWDAAQDRRERQAAKHRYKVAMSYTAPVQCTCSHCGNTSVVAVEKDALASVGVQLLHYCPDCSMVTAFNVIDISGIREKDPTPIVAAFKQNYIKPRFWNQYALIVGREMRWYLDYSPRHKTVYYCSKWHRLAGTRQGFTIFYAKRQCSINEVVAEIVALEELSAQEPNILTCGTTLSPAIKTALRRQRILRICTEYGLAPVFQENSVIIRTDIGEWKFDYSRDRITLLHRNSRGATIDPVSGAVVDYHVQYSNATKTVEDVIKGIVEHDKWRAGLMPSKQEL